ncbi:MAG: hypothetical protein AB1427_19900 [Thermodesulfobacteriota bacterium]
MATIDEKRKGSRYRLNAALVCRTNLSGAAYQAKKIDHSDAGISFRSNYDLKPGTIVYIRRESCPQNCPGEEACESCRTVTLATVKWCRHREVNGTGSYLTGAKYV